MWDLFGKIYVFQGKLKVNKKSYRRKLKCASAFPKINYSHGSTEPLKERAEIYLPHSPGKADIGQSGTLSNSPITSVCPLPELNQKHNICVLYDSTNNYRLWKLNVANLFPTDKMAAGR